MRGFSDVLSFPSPDWPSCPWRSFRLGTVPRMVRFGDTDTVPHWTGGGRWDCVGGDNRQYGCLPGSNPHRRAERSLRHTRPCLDASRRVWNCCGASLPATSSCRGPEQYTLSRVHDDGPRMMDRFQECFVGSFYRLAFQQIRWKTW